MKELIKRLLEAKSNSQVVAFGYTKIKDGTLAVYAGYIEDLDVKKGLVWLQTKDSIKSFRLSNILNHEAVTL
jgi:hypothetical protein